MNAETAVTLATTACAAGVDLRCGRIPDALSYGALAAVLACALVDRRLEAALVGLAVAGGALLALHAGTRGRGLGLGDVKLACSIGAALGASAAVAALAWAFVLGAIVATAGLLVGRLRRGQRLPFAPYLALGVAVAVAVNGPAAG